MTQRYPIGLQSFKEIREGGYLYIDKTERIFSLIDRGKYYFLSRPRRFGKSLLISTLSEIFQGNKQLFKGLWIEDKITWKTHPIIQIGFSSLGYKDIGLETAILLRLEEIAKQYNIQLSSQGMALKFRELITTLSIKNQVVILIDEYDKPIIDYLDSIDQAYEHRELLKNFYSVIKDMDEAIRFLCITGVSKFSKVSLFSDLNNLHDITMHPRYNDICGYTQDELEHYFKYEIEQLAQEKGLPNNELILKIQEWYNGYRWATEVTLYNPFSILNFFDSGTFQNFWFSTGTPTFLIKVLAKELDFNFEHIEASEYAFDSFQLENINPVTLLFQTGYITIKSHDELDIYHLSYPNKEVKYSLTNYLLANYAHHYTSEIKPYIAKIHLALANEDINELILLFNQLFASIPYQIFIANKEAYFHSIIFLTLQLLDYYIQAEVSHHRGRLDTVLYTKHAIYIIEFKLDQNAAIALEQIKQKAYSKSFVKHEKKVCLLGINFSSIKKEIDDWALEEV